MIFRDADLISEGGRSLPEEGKGKLLSLRVGQLETERCGGGELNDNYKARDIIRDAKPTEGLCGSAGRRAKF